MYSLVLVLVFVVCGAVGGDWSVVYQYIDCGLWRSVAG